MQRYVNGELETFSPEEEAALLAEQAAAQAAALAALTADDYGAAIQTHIDATAQSRNYADGDRLVGYVTSTIQQWAAEAQAFLLWRDAVEVYAYAQLDAVLAGQRTQPTVEEFIDEIKTQHPAPWPV